MAITRLGSSGIPREPNGSFSGKVASGGGRVIARVTRLGVSGFTRGLYGSFAGKSSGAPVVESRPTGGGGKFGRSGYIIGPSPFKRKKDDLKMKNNRALLALTLALAYFLN